MSDRELPDWITSYSNYLHDTEAPDLFKKWVAISTIAACLKRKCWLRWHRHAMTFPNFYIVLVGPPAIGKGVAMGAASNMLRHCGIRISAQSATRQALIRDLTEATETEMLEDESVRLHSSLTIFSKELAVFLNQKDYQLISDLTDWYDCEDIWTYDTVSRGKESIEGLFVNLIGATTPEILQSTLPEGAVGGGLTSRIVFVYADKKSRCVPVPMESAQDELLQTCLKNDLERISFMSGEFKLEKLVVDKWITWYLEQESTTLFANTRRLLPYVGRRQAHFLKLMMVVSASRSSECVIRAVDFDTALLLLEECEMMMPKVFQGYGRSSISDLLPIYMKDISTRKRMLKREFAEQHVSDLDPADLDRVLQTLTTIGFCRIIETGTGDVIEFIPEHKRVVLKPMEEKKDV